MLLVLNTRVVPPAEGVDRPSIGDLNCRQAGMGSRFASGVQKCHIYPTFLQRRITGWGGIPRLFGSAFAMLMLSLDLTGLQISFRSLAVESWPGCALPIRFFSREGHSKHVGAGDHPIKPATGVTEVDSIISGNCSTCWPVNKTNC
jgi:hypothetical protein